MLIPPPQMGKSAWLVVERMLMVLMSSVVEGECGSRTKIRARSGVFCLRCGDGVRVVLGLVLSVG